jgi:hypothetical protein
MGKGGCKCARTGRSFTAHSRQTCVQNQRRHAERSEASLTSTGGGGGLNTHIFQKEGRVFQKKANHLDLVRFSRIRSDSVGFFSSFFPKNILKSPKIDPVCTVAI